MIEQYRKIRLKLFIGIFIALFGISAAVSSSDSAEIIINPSISLPNPQENRDAETIKSFSDAFLWSSGVETQLLLKLRAKLNIVYVPNFDDRVPIEISDKEIREIYDTNFDLIKSIGECGTLRLTSVENFDRFSVLFLSPTSRPELRLGCIYARFREMFGLERDEKRISFEDNFVSDMVTLHCQSMKSKHIDTANATNKSICRQ